MRFSLCALLASLAIALSTVTRGVEVYYAHTITSGNYSDAGSDLGNDGYWFAVFARPGADAGNGLVATANEADALPAYITQSFGPTVDGSGGWAGYYDITLPNGTLGNSGALEMNNEPTGPAGTRAEYMTLTFGAGAPSKLRIGVVTDNGDGLAWSNAQIIVNDESTGPLTNDLVPDVHFFDLINISPGDSVRIDGVTVGATVSHLGGVLLDTVTSLDLQVNTNTGQVTMLTPAADLDIQGYTIASASGSLNPGGWTSLEGRTGFGNGNPTDGLGWEKLGPGIATKVGEFNLLDSTLFGPSGESGLSLGALFSPGGTEDLHVQITTADGGVINGVVHYVDAPGLEGDYNGDNVVDAADYLVWRNSAGQMGPNLPADGNGDSKVDGEDYIFWKERYGNAAPGALVAPVSVPEPSAALLVGMVIPVALLARVRMKAILALIVTTFALPAYAERYPDRLYRLGDDPTEGAVDNQAIGSGSSNFTYDSVGTLGNGSLQDLSLVGTATYVNTTAGPQDGVRGASFTGAGYLVHSNGLGYPGAMPNPAENYTGVTSRGMQAWVNPIDNDALQYIIYDTEQFGIRINADGTWGMIWGAAAAGSTVGRAYNSNVPVNFGQWNHIHQHSYGNTQGVLYVNGVAVASSLTGQIYQTAATPELDPQLVVGGDLSTLNQNLYTGLIDEIELYVSGQGASQDFGTFHLGEDNGYIASLGLTEGDLNGDDVVNDADVALFVSNWRAEKRLSGRRVGDITTRNLGDFDYDGFVGLSDWYILTDEHVNGASLNLAALLAGQSASVPEPASIGLLSLAGLLLLRGRRGRLARRYVLLGSLMPVLALSSGVANAAGYWNVDFQGDINGTLGAQTPEIKNYGPDAFGIWNHLEVAGLRTNPQEDFTTNPSWDLLDNDGNASSVNLSLVGDYAGWHGDGSRTDDLRGDYIILLKNAALGFPDPHLEMNITGLLPNRLYSFSVITGTEGSGRHLLVSVDGAGDGSVANDPVVQANQATTRHFTFTSSPTGAALIEIDPVNNEGNLAGIQLKLGERLPVLTINRTTGEMVVSNDTAQAASVLGYMIESSAGSLLPSQWTSITDNFDADSGDHSVDSTFNWMKLTQPTERDNLSEVQQIGGTGASIADGQDVNLGNAWIRSPYQDVSGEVLLSDGTIVPLEVRYTGNAAVIGDLDYNGVVDLDDWAVMKTAFSTDLTSFSLAELYGAGDLNLDGRVNLRDMHAFAAAYDAMQGAGAFAAAVGSIAAVPEPTTCMGLLLFAVIAGVGIRTRKTGQV